MWQFILVHLVVGVFAATNNDALWHQWKRMYNKEYNEQEDAHRRAIWEENVQHIQEHNLKHDLGMVTYTLGLNQFTDMTFEEFKAKYLSQIQLASRNPSNGFSFEPGMSGVPESVDWRQFDYVTSIKEQGDCGSCWAFATTGAVEGQYAKNYGILKQFSTQQLIDCTTDYGNKGCNGGLVEPSYDYLKLHGLFEEDVYPYNGTAGLCWAWDKEGFVRVVDYLYIHDGNETRLKEMVGKRGPVAILIDVGREFSWYSKGIFQTTNCWNDRHSLNHAVLLVGYGSERGQDYWIVKNSWGSEWGESGYIRMARNKDNMCGIATLASIPVVRRYSL